MDAKDSPVPTPQAPVEDSIPASDFRRRIERISLVMMIYGSASAGACMVIAALLPYPNPYPVRDAFMAMSGGCVLAFLLGTFVYVGLVAFGVMRVSLASLLISLLVFGGSLALIVSGIYALSALGGLGAVVLLIYWVYRFFEAAYEWDRRNGRV